MLAIISDIHSNTEALEAVLADIDERGVERIICLGDVVGYGPEPAACLDTVRRRASIMLMGNHDFAVLYEPRQFNLAAESAAFWSRRQLEEESDLDARNERWDFLGGLSIKQVIDGEDLGAGPITLVHGSPRRPVNEYVFADDVYNNTAKMAAIFERFEHLCFVGHTHIPGVFLQTPDFYSPDELGEAYEIDPVQKALINVGSVGQPRDRDTRASYVIVDDGEVQFIRVPYPIEPVVEKVKAIDALDNYVGTRLLEGR